METLRAVIDGMGTPSMVLADTLVNSDAPIGSIVSQDEIRQRAEFVSDFHEILLRVGGRVDPSLPIVR